MVLSAYPTDDWGKDEYWKDVKLYQRDMVTVSKMNLTRKQKGCCKNITKTITESISILESSGKKLNRPEKQQLYELAVLRLCNLASFFTKS